MRTDSGIDTAALAEAAKAAIERAKDEYGDDYMDMTVIGPQVRVRPGVRYEGTMPYSEVCMHMRISGKRMGFELLPGRHAVQLYGPDGSPFSSAVTPGEAGLYQCHGGDGYYFYPEQKYQ